MPRTVLIVDDGAINRELLKRTLSADYDILEAENGKEGLALMHRHFKILSAVLLDIVMPEMDGYEVLRHAKENPLLTQIPIIIVTGSEDESYRVKALSLGANDFILKPFNPEIIKHCLRNNIALRETASILNAIQKDKLTGLYNREAFFEKVSAAVKAREPGAYVLSCFDIDNFKLINDQFGAVEGDRILHEVGVAVREDMAAIDGIGSRISADNFALLYPVHGQDTSPMQRLMAQNLVLLEQQAVAFSVGRYIVNDLTLPASALYDRAYIAKQSIKGRYDKHLAYFDEEMLERLVMNQQITAEMEPALRNQQFEVWFQPQFNHETGALIGAEALARWRHPLKGIVPPSDFIPLFEQNGFVYELDKFVWRETCRLLRKWIDEERHPLPVSVNVSRYDIFRADLFDVITGLVREFDLPPALLRLEITESAFASSTATIVRIVRQLIDFGFTIEIDDFGSGYSSLNTLKSVPAQVVKLDMRFLEGEEEGARGGNILESIVRMTKWLGMTVLAEGVADRDQADFLRSIGCSYVQGYLYARPMPAKQYEPLCGGSGVMEPPFTLETVSGLDFHSFWDPKSTDSFIFNNYGGGACIYEYYRDHIELIRVSESYARMVFGPHMSVEKLMNIDWEAHTDPASYEALRDAVEMSIETGREISGEYLFTGLPGCPQETRLRSALRVIASVGDRYLVYCVSENITAENAARLRAVDDAKQRELLLNSILGGVATYEGSSASDMRLTYFNDGFCRLFGYTREEYTALASTTPMALAFEEDQPMLRERIAALLAGGPPLDCVYRVHVKDGGYKWVNLKSALGEPRDALITANAVLFDVTAQQETLERLRVSEEVNRLAMEHSNNVVCRYTVADRTLNTGVEAAALFGRPARIEDVPYAPVKEGLIAPESKDAYIGFFESILNGDKHGRAVFRTKTASDWRWLEAHFSTIFSATDAPVFAVVSFRDMTEQLEKEAAYNKWRHSLQDKDPKTYTLVRCNLSQNTAMHAQEGTLLHASYTDGEQSFDTRAQAYIQSFVYEDDKPALLALLHCDALLAGFYRGTRSRSLDYREKQPDGGYRWLRVSVDAFEFPNSADIVANLMFEDIDDAKRAELQMQHLAEIDPLTGVWNRNAFSAKVAEALKNARADAQHALLMLDIDGFKLVNDVFGHAEGDQTLVNIASTLRATLRRGDLIGRLGGDEFLVFLGDIPDERVAVNKARQICALVRKSFNLEVQISGSVGIALAPRDGTDFETLYKRADSALYHVKGSGKDNYTFYHDNISDEDVPDGSKKLAMPWKKERKRRMLIVDDSRTDFVLLAAIFEAEFSIEHAADGPSALISLRHYGSAISIVLLDLIMPGLDGFAVLEKMQANAELAAIPVIVVTGDEDRSTCLRAINGGASDFVTKPVDPELLRLRVHAAISKSDNERLRVKSSYRALQDNELLRYRTVLERTGTVVEHDWIRGSFSYDPSIAAHIAGSYDDRRLWRILLSDMVTDPPTVRRMQEFVHDLAKDRTRVEGAIKARLKTPSGEPHWFLMTVYKLVNEFGLTDKLILTFHDLGENEPA